MDQLEFLACLDGYRKHREDAMEGYAWLAATIINHMPSFSKNRQKVTPRQLLGDTRGQHSAGSPAEFHEMMQKRNEPSDDEE